MKVNEFGVLPASDIFFHTPSAAAKSAFYYIECAGSFQCDEHYCVSRDNFMGFLMMVIEEGCGICEASGREAEFAQGDVVLLDSSRPHIYAALGPLKMRWMHFNGSTSRAFFELVTARTNVFTPTDSRAFSAALSEIIGGFANGKPLPEAIVSCTIQSLLTELLLLDAPHESNQPFMQNAVDYIETHYGQPISLKQLSREVNLSPYHFCRRFRQDTGFSPHEFIIITRLNVARQLLMRTARPVKEIAFDAGFGSESHFVSTFKKHMGITPGEFRSSRRISSH